MKYPLNGATFVDLGWPLRVTNHEYPNDIRNDEICDLERILKLIPLENLSFSIIFELDGKTNAASLRWNPDSIRSISRESV